MGSIRESKKKDGSITYNAEVRLKSYPKQRGSFRTRKLAKKWIQDTESAIRDGRHVRIAESKKHTVKDLIDRFTTQWLSQFPHRLANQTIHLDWWKNRLGHILLCDLSPDDIAQSRNALLSEITVRKKLRNPSTVNRYLASFSKALTIAMKEWGWIDDNPMRKVSKPTEGNGRNRLLSLDEKDRLLKECKISTNPHLFPIVSLALLTGMRFGEIVGLKWEEIDQQHRTITIEKTKNGERRILPLTQDVERILINYKNSDISHGLIFKPNGSTNRSGLVYIRKVFAKALQRANIQNFRFHDLRHTAASFLAMSGATQGELMEILGHRSPHMTKRYAHFTHKHISDLMERTQRKFNTAIFT